MFPGIVETHAGESTHDGFGEIAENHGGFWDCVAAQGGGDYCGGAGDAQRESGGGAGDEGRSGNRCDLRGREAAEETGAAAVFPAAQAEGLCDYGERSRRATDGDGADEEMP